jgi:hypothetical protein
LKGDILDYEKFFNSDNLNESIFVRLPDQATDFPGGRKGNTVHHSWFSVSLG